MIKPTQHYQDGFVLKDEKGNIYGRYDTEVEAVQAAHDWNAYYADED